MPSICSSVIRMSDDRINELEHRSIETSQSETQREKKKENIEQSIQELWGHFKRSHLCMVLEYQKEKQEQGGKKYLKLILVLCSCSVAQFCLALCDPWTAAHQVSLSITISWSLLKLMSIEEVMPSNHLILCHPLLLLPSIFPSTRVFFSESALHIG